MSKRLIFIISTLFVLQISTYYWGYTVKRADEAIEKRMKTLFAKEFENPLNVTSLDLSGQNLTYLPDCFDVFIQLNTINLSNNQFTKIPSNLSDFYFLETVDLSNNKIAFVGLKNLSRKIRNLNLSHNQLETFEIRETLITNLNLSHNQIKNINIPSYEDLIDTIDLSFNQLQNIQNIKFEEVAILKFLNLSNNQFTKLAINNVSLLTINELDCSNNNLNDIDLESFETNNIVTLNISNNPIKSAPKYRNLNVENLIVDKTGDFLLFIDNLPRTLYNLQIPDFTKVIFQNEIDSEQKLFEDFINLENLGLYGLTKSITIKNEVLSSLKITNTVDDLTLKLETPNLYSLTVNENSLKAILKGNNQFPILRELTIDREIYEANNPPKEVFEFQKKYPDVWIEGFEIERKAYQLYGKVNFEEVNDF